MNIYNAIIVVERQAANDEDHNNQLYRYHTINVYLHNYLHRQNFSCICNVLMLPL